MSPGVRDLARFNGPVGLMGESGKGIAVVSSSAIPAL
jgi:hypothetical protein